MNNRNYQRELDNLIGNIKKEQKTPTLFLHSCCAPCSSYVLEYLSRYFEITVLYYTDETRRDVILKAREMRKKGMRTAIRRRKEEC